MSYALGRYFEDFTEGEVLTTLGRTVTEADIVNFCGFSGDFNPLHTDKEFAADSPFKGRIAHGMCGMAIASGLMVRLNILEGTILAFFGIENWRFKAPIMIGDTIHCEISVVETKATNKPDRGLVKIAVDVLNQNGISTQSGTMVALMKTRPQQEAVSTVRSKG